MLKIDREAKNILLGGNAEMRNVTITTNDAPYVFDVDVNGVPALTEKNYQFIEALIQNDSAYRFPKTRDKNFMILLKEGIPKTYHDVLLSVQLIDKADSTHLSSEGAKYKGKNRGREITAKKIYGLINGNHLESELLNGSAVPIHEIANAVNEKHYEEYGNSQNTKYNISFATKYCSYVARYSLGKDLYCIYDGVLRRIIPYYAKMYCGEMINSISIKSAKDYCRYKELIDRIIDNAEKITGYRATYKELDGLLWYYFKGEDSRIKKAANCIRKLKGDKK